MIHEIAKGAKQVRGVKVSVFRVLGHEEDEDSERFAAEVEATPVLTHERLRDADAIIFGAPCRQGHVASQLLRFLDEYAQDPSLAGILEGKVASAFTSTGGIGRGYGGHEHVLQNLHSTFLQLGMVVCGLPPCDHMDKAGLAGPLGITMAGAAGSGGRSLDASEVHLARLQGRHTATMARTVRSPMQLIYWNWKGRAEMTRILLQVAGIPYEETNLRDLSEFQQFSKRFVEDRSVTQTLSNLSVAQLPVLVDGSIVISHSQAVARYVARKAGLYGESFAESSQIDMVFEAAEEIRTKLYQASFSEDRDTRLGELADTIIVDLARFENDLRDVFASTKTLFFVGTKLSLADIVVFSVVKSLRSQLPQVVSRFHYLSRFLATLEDQFATKPRRTVVTTPKRP